MVQGNETIACRLLATRIARGLTRNLARTQLGYTFDTYVATETGVRLPMAVEIPALAIWLGVPAEQLFGAIDLLKEQLAVERAARRTPSPEVAPAPDASPVSPCSSGSAEIHGANPTAGALA